MIYIVVCSTCECFEILHLTIAGQCAILNTGKCGFCSYVCVQHTYSTISRSCHRCFFCSKRCLDGFANMTLCIKL